MMRALQWRSRLTFTIACLSLASCVPVASGPIDAPSAQACLVVDTDAAVDDLRALAILVRHRRVAAIVTTGGGTEPGTGAAIVRYFLRDAGAAPIPIFVGRAAPPGPGAQADSQYLTNSAHPYGATVTFSPEAQTPDLRQSLTAALSGCGDVSLILLGPWTSTRSYLPLPVLRTVVAQGRPDLDGQNGRPVSWNCGHDPEACAKGQQLLAGNHLTWVDARSGEAVLTQSMLDQLPQASFGAAVRRVSALGRLDPSEYGLWDDLVALAVIRPELFVGGKTHAEARVARPDLTAAWVQALTSAPAGAARGSR